MGGNFGKIRIKVEYHMLCGGPIPLSKYKFLKPHELSHWRGKIWFPELEEGNFISQVNEAPEGMFVFERFDEKERKFMLREIDCDPIHWKGDVSGRGHGPNELCRKKRCRYYDNCPISIHMMMCADID